MLLKFKPPYYAVIFASTLTGKKSELYNEINNELLESIKDIEGYLGHEGARDAIGIAVIYFENLEAVDRWRKHERHQFAKKLGVSDFYDEYSIRVCKVEYEKNWER